MEAFLRQDWPAAAAHARAALPSQPWRGEGAVLAVVSLARLATSSLEEGDLAGAQDRFQEALNEAQAFLPRDPSDDWAHHAVFLAARGLAVVRGLRGNLPPAFLPDQEAKCEEALRMSPGSAELQDDWLGLHILEAQREAEAGQDPQRQLDEAMIFQGTRLREPLSPALGADRMAVYALLAARSLERGEDPFPALGEALKIPGNPPAQIPDLRARVLAIEARALAARGKDPAPALDEALASLEHSPGSQFTWTAALTASELWLTRAAWTHASRGDALPGALKAESLAAGALQVNGASARALALSGLALALQGDLLPATRVQLRKVARDRLRASLAQAPCEPLQARLRRALKEP